jgi:hypothetical protein
VTKSINHQSINQSINQAINQSVIIFQLLNVITEKNQQNGLYKNMQDLASLILFETNKVILC